MAADHRAQVEDLLADYRRSRDQLAAVHQALATVSESATGSNSLVTATVGGSGTLTGLVIADEAYRQYRPADLAQEILRLTAIAAARASRAAGQVIAPVLPAGTDPEALLGGTADLTRAESAPRPAAGEAEETFENVTWMDTGSGDKR